MLRKSISGRCTSNDQPLSTFKLIRHHSRNIVKFGQRHLLSVGALLLLVLGSAAAAVTVGRLALPQIFKSPTIATAEPVKGSSKASKLALALQQCKGAANLDQARNGSQASPLSPVNLQNGNAGASNSHYVEGQSIPYRVVLTDLPMGASITLTLGFDLKHSGKYAIDYLTSYQRLQPHVYTTHTTPETVDPLVGLSGTFAAPNTFPLPIPTAINSPVSGQPTASFNALPPAEKVMTIYNGTITGIAYTNQGDLTAAQSEARVSVTFTPTSDTAVLAWGGHIGSRADWGFVNGVPQSAGGISGAPYHMRLIGWVNNTAPPCLSNLGNQDRSLSADAVVPPPTCGVTGSTVVCANSINTYNSTTDAANATYQWSLPTNTSGATIQGSTTGSSVQVNAGTAGNYTIQVAISANGFTSTCSTSVTVSPQPVTVASNNGPVCANGTLQLSATGDPGDTYSWTGPNNFTSALQTPTIPNVTAAASGIYSVTRYVNGCASAPATTTVNQPSPLMAEATATNILCFGGDSTVTVTASGGTAPYTGIGTFTRKAGTHTFIVTDANGCSISQTVTIAEPPALMMDATATAIACFGGDSTVTVTASGGSGSYTGTGTFTRKAGAHSFTVTDANGCSVQKTVTITEPTPLTASETHAAVLCNGGNTGTINLSVNGGTPGYSFLWNDGVTSEDRTGLTAGNYSVTVTDAQGCTTSKSVTITEPTALVASETHTNVSCNGGANGAIDLSVSGGTSGYTFLWNDGVTTEDRTGLMAGNYSVVVTDANGCSTQVNATVTQPTAITPSVAVTNATCFGGYGDVNLTVSGGAEQYTFLWSNGATTEDLISVAAGDYKVTITDANGCTATASATVTQPSQLTAGSSATPIACFGGDSTVTITANGGTAPYTGTGTFTRKAGTHSFTVTDANGCSTTTSVTITEPSVLAMDATATAIACFGGDSTVTVTASGGTAPYTGTGTFIRKAGTHSFTVTDANGCSVQKSVTITEPPPLTVAITGPTEVCLGSSVTLSAGTGYASYLWSNGATTSSITVSPAVTTAYSVTVTNANGCTASASFTVTTKDCLIGFCSYTQGGWGATPQGNNPARLLSNNFGAVFPGGIEIGIPGAGVNQYSMKFTSALAVQNYLPAGGTPRPLTADTPNDPTSSSAGVFGGQVLALKINVAISGTVPQVPPGFGSLIYTGAGSLQNMTIAQILAAMETALGGGALPAGYTIAGLNDLATNLNEAFDNCQTSAWARANLKR